MVHPHPQVPIHQVLTHQVLILQVHTQHNLYQLDTLPSRHHTSSTLRGITLHHLLVQRLTLLPLPLPQLQ